MGFKRFQALSKFNLKDSFTMMVWVFMMMMMMMMMMIHDFKMCQVLDSSAFGM